MKHFLKTAIKLALVLTMFNLVTSNVAEAQTNHLGFRTGHGSQTTINEDDNAATRGGTIDTGIDVEIASAAGSVSGFSFRFVNVSAHGSGSTACPATLGSFFSAPTSLSGQHYNILLDGTKNFNYESQSKYCYQMELYNSSTQNSSTRIGFVTGEVLITDINDTPVLTRTGSHATNIVDGRTAATIHTGFIFSVADQDSSNTHTWNVSNNKFAVDASSGALYIKSGQDLNMSNPENMNVSASDNGNKTSNVVATRITMAQGAFSPSVTLYGTQVSLNEGTYATDTTTGITLRVTDPNPSSTFTYTYSDSKFKVVVNNNITHFAIAANASFNFEAKSVFTVTVTVDDGTHSSNTEKVTTITISDINEAPNISRVGSQRTLNEGTYNTATTTGFYFTKTDPDANDTIAYTSSDNRFAINSSNELEVRANASFDYENTAHRSITLTVTGTDSGGLTDTEVVTITISNINDTGPAISQSGTQTRIVEGTVAVQTDAGLRFAFSDPEGGTPRIVSWLSDSNRFRLINGTLFVKANAVFDYEVLNQRNTALTVFATSYNITTNHPVVINISNVDEGPVITRTGIVTLNESTSATGYARDTNTGITLLITDPENDAVVINVSDSRFTINNTNLQIKAGNTFDYEDDSHRQHIVTISATANGKSTATVVTVNVRNVVEDIALVNTVIAPIEIFNSQDLSVNLSAYVLPDANATNISYTLVGDLPTDWTSLTLNANNALVGSPPIVEDSRTVAFAISVNQNSATSSSNLMFTLNVILSKVNLAEISKLVMPGIFDAVIAQGTGAVVNRVASLQSDEINNPFEREILTALVENQEKINQGEINLYQVLKGRDLALGYHDGDYSATDYGMWLSFDFNNIEANEDNLQYDGSIYSFSTGVDYQFVNGGILGLAYSNNRGEINFSRSANNNLTGLYDLNLNLVQPYYSHDFGDLGFWLSLGSGAGDLDITVDNNENNVENYDLSLFSSAIGFDAKVADLDLVNVSLPVELFGELQLSQLAVEKNTQGLVDEDYDQFNLRSGVTFAQDYNLEPNTNATSKLGFAFVTRNTSGYADASGSGYEIFANLEIFVHDLPLHIESDISYIAISAQDLEQISGGLAVTYRNASSRLGSFVEINPEFRSKGAVDIYDLAVNEEQDIDETNLLLSSNIGYGFGVVGGVLTPYGEYLIDHNNAKYGLGIKYNQADKLTWSLGVNNDFAKTQETMFSIEYKVVN